MSKNKTDKNRLFLFFKTSFIAGALTLVQVYYNIYHAHHIDKHLNFMAYISYSMYSLPILQGCAPPLLS